MAESISPEQAEKTVRDCVCSDCWGQLTARYNPKTRTSTVRCSTPGCPCNGYRSRKGVEREEGEAVVNALEAKQALRSAMPWLPKKSETKLLAEMGF
jgi:hypothetical protein